jgi:hypothetical protein
MKLDKRDWLGIVYLLLRIAFFLIPILLINWLFRSIKVIEDYISDNIVVFFFHPYSGENNIISIILSSVAVIIIPVVFSAAWFFLFGRLEALILKYFK